MAPRRRGLAGLLGAVGVSTLGTRMSLLALPWFVLTTTGSPTLTGLIAAVELTPYVAVQAIGGPVIDRVGAWATSTLTDTGAAVLVGLIPLLHLVHGLDLPMLYLLVGGVGALRGAGDASRDVLLPGVGALAETPLERSAGLFDGMNRGGSLIGAPLAGVLIGITDAINVLAIDAASFAVSAVLVAVLVPRSAQPEPSGGQDGREGYFAALGEGFRFIRGDRLLLGIGAMVLVTNMLDQASGAVFVPVWAERVAHSAVALGLISGVFSVGAVTGNVVTTWLGPRLPRRWTYAVGFLFTGGPRLLTLAAASALSPVLVVSLIAGLGAGGINPILGAVQFERVPRRLQIRVLGVVNATAWAGMPVGGLAGGALTEALGIRPALLIAGLAYLVTTLSPFVFPAWRDMDRAERPVPEPVAVAAR
jgi:MFS family permease